mmetsp:Transcript_1604/g.6336  ORF Transcript_1604/g.6336 Transcript_1604/m.6336 type:complete len:352 (-) Transcript_1604:204-1259(-)
MLTTAARSSRSCGRGSRRQGHVRPKSANARPSETAPCRPSSRGSRRACSARRSSGENSRRRWAACRHRSRRLSGTRRRWKASGTQCRPRSPRLSGKRRRRSASATSCRMRWLTPKSERPQRSASATPCRTRSLRPRGERRRRSRSGTACGGSLTRFAPTPSRRSRGWPPILMRRAARASLRARACARSRIRLPGRRPRSTTACDALSSSSTDSSRRERARSRRAATSRRSWRRRGSAATRSVPRRKRHRRGWPPSSSLRARPCTNSRGKRPRHSTRPPTARESQTTCGRGSSRQRRAWARSRKKLAPTSAVSSRSWRRQVRTATGLLTARRPWPPNSSLRAKAWNGSRARL